MHNGLFHGSEMDEREGNPLGQDGPGNVVRQELRIEF